MNTEAIAKGDLAGACAHTACNTGGANWWNPYTRKFYCEPCAQKINSFITDPTQYHLRCVHYSRMGERGRV